MEFLKELESLKDQLGFSGTFKVPERTDHVVIAGMGGSGVVGAAFKELYTKAKISLVDDYAIPDFVDDKTLFISISYSGNTAETLSATELAKKRGARTVSITSGGALAGMAEQTVMVPGGLSPRSAFGYMLMPLIRSFNAVSANSINEAYRKILDVDEDNSEEQRIAKEIFAKKAIPVIYGVSPYKAVAYRWKTQINENSKLLAYASSFPELNHNDTMALHSTYRKKEFYFMAFTDGLNKLIEDRIEATERLTNTKLVRIRAEGNSQFARAMHVLHKGDYVSYHLALLRGKDPLDITVIKDLKKTLGGK